MKSLVVIDACVRQSESRTLRIAAPLIEALSRRYTVTRFRLPEMDIVPLTPALYAGRGNGEIPSWAADAARAIADADRILIAAPFWDMSFPAVLKCFFEQTSLFDITFTDNGTTCVGLCKALSRLWNLGELTTLSAQNMDYSTAEEIEARIAAAVSEGLTLAQTW